MFGQIVIPITAVADIVAARQSGRELAHENGLSGAESTLVATIISELARNIVLYAHEGEIRLERTNNSDRQGVIIVSKYNGPGIEDVRRVLVGGYSTSGGLGLGLSGIKRIADEFRIETATGKGTTVVATVWTHNGQHR